MQLPAPPQSANIEEMFVYMKSLHNLLKNLLLTGTQISMVDSSQIAAMTSENQLSQVAKLFYDAETDEYYRTKKSGDNLVVETW